MFFMFFGIRLAGKLPPIIRTTASKVGIQSSFFSISSCLFEPLFLSWTRLVRQWFFHPKTPEIGVKKSEKFNIGLALSLLVCSVAIWLIYCTTFSVAIDLRLWLASFRLESSLADSPNFFRQRRPPYLLTFPTNHTHNQKHTRIEHVVGDSSQQVDSAR